MKCNPIPYTQEQLKGWLDYDRETGTLYWKVRKARCIRVGDLAGVYNHVSKKRGSYVLLTLDGKQYFAHRVIWKWLYNEDFVDMQIDHRDGNGLNNAEVNLRLSTAQQNSYNKGLLPANRTGIKGVVELPTGLLRAQVYKDRKCFYKYFSNTEKGWKEAEEFASDLREALHSDFVNHGESK